MSKDHPPTFIESAESCGRKVLADITDFANKEPVTAVAAAFGVGLLINLLPTRLIVGTVTVVGATLMRPVLLSLGVTKVLELCCQTNPNKPNS